MSTSAFRTLILCLTVALMPAPAMAEQSAQETRAQAREHARQARVQYDLGRFTEALAEYEAAYELLPAPGVLFNLGQCHRLLGHLERAVFFFEGYLRQLPEAPNRADVEELLARSRLELGRQREAAAEAAAAEAAAAEAAAAEAAAAEAAAAEAEAAAEAAADDEAAAAEAARRAQTRRPVHRTWWFWTVVGAVVLGTGLGVGLGVGLNSEPTTVLPGGSLGTLDAREGP